MQIGGLRTKEITKTSTPEKPLITVVTVVYNGAATLEQTIQSVVSQTYDNVEYIIIDGASTDATLDIIKKYEDKIDYWQSEADKGIYDAMNKGIGLASGEYIALLNSGDWYENNTIETIVESYKQHSETDIFYALMRVLSEEKKEVLWVYGYGHKVLDSFMISHPTSFVRKCIYEKYKYNLNYKSAADYDLFLTLYQQGCSFYFVEKILANYLLGGMSDSFTGKKESVLVQYRHKTISFSTFIFKYLYFSLMKKLKG